jgi:phosphohistidine phosphatase
MRQLYLLRHAKSSWDQPGGADFDRPLNARGRADAALLNALLLESRIGPEVVLCSPAARTLETLGFLAPALAHAAIHHEQGIYEAPPERLLAILKQVPAGVRSVMIIGHNPGLEQLARLLIDSRNPGEMEALSRLHEKFPTGALARLAVSHPWPDLAEASCALQSFVRPADLKKA